MARFIPDGTLQVWFVPTIANMAEPTLSEITDGDDATGFLRALSTPLDGSVVDVSDASSKYNKTAPGTYGGQEVTAEFYRDSDQANDTIWNLLPRGTTTHIVIARRGGSGSGGELQADDYVDVWPVQVVTRNPADYTRNEPTGFTVTFSVPDEPVEDVKIVAGD